MRGPRHSDYELYLNLDENQEKIRTGGRSSMSVTDSDYGAEAYVGVAPQRIHIDTELSRLALRAKINPLPQLD